MHSLTVALAQPHRALKWVLWITSTVTLIITLLFALARPAVALFPIPNVGGIVVTAPEIDGVNMAFTASTSQTALQQSWPTAKLTSDSLRFPKGLVITKTVDVSATALATYGIDEVIFRFTISQVNTATGAALQLSGLQADQTSFTTGYDSSGNPVLITSSGTQPLSDVSSIQVSKLTNVSLNVHQLNFANCIWSVSSMQVIAADSNGNPLGGTNGSFTYDTAYGNQVVTP